MEETFGTASLVPLAFLQLYESVVINPIHQSIALVISLSCLFLKGLLYYIISYLVPKRDSCYALKGGLKEGIGEWGRMEPVSSQLMSCSLAI